jgi:hypothetical protein
VINITTAMKIRNKLKSRLQTLQGGIERIDFSVSVEDEDPATKKWPALDYKTYDEALAEIDLTREDLRRLNLAMEDANGVNRMALNELHSLEAAIDWEERMLQASRGFREKREEYDHEADKKVTKLYRVASKRDFVARLAKLRERKDELEALVSKNNGSVEVKFLLTEGVKLY